MHCPPRALTASTTSSKVEPSLSSLSTRSFSSLWSLRTSFTTCVPPAATVFSVPADPSVGCCVAADGPASDFGGLCAAAPPDAVRWRAPPPAAFWLDRRFFITGAPRRCRHRPEGGRRNSRYHGP